MWQLLGVCLGIFMGVISRMPAVHAADPVAVSCDEGAAVNGYNSWLSCLSAPPPCLGLGPYACVCSQCKYAFQNFIIQYIRYTSQPMCQFSDPALVYNVIQILTEFNCFIMPGDCSTYAANPFCTQLPYLQQNNMVLAGSNVNDLCVEAVNDSCATIPGQPMCTGAGYVVNTNSPNTYIPGAEMTIYELMCAPTSRFATKMNTATGYSVTMVPIGNGTASTAPLSLNQIYYSPPVVFAPVDCDSSVPTLEMEGSLMKCVEGMRCDYIANGIRRITYCPGGSVCSTTAGTQGTTVTPCEKGTYCPIASTTPKKCGLFEICGAKAIRPVKLIGLFAFGVCIAVIIGLFMFTASFEAGQRLIARNANASPGKSEPVIKPAAPISIRFSGLSAHVITNASILARFNLLGPRVQSERRTILSSATGAFISGRLTAVMGPSGSGKTTLVNCVLGKVVPSAGSVNINGKNESLAKYGPVFGVVPQNDTMLPMLTVQDVLIHSAKTRLPRTTSSADIKLHVEYTLSILGLSHIRESIIGDETSRGISGGEKKRVNIGIELVANPSFLIADEPTTGLDAAAALECATVLKKIARTQRTVVCIVHQPRFEIFDMFDDLVLLDATGTTVYSGPVRDAVLYFATKGFVCPATLSPPDFLLDLVSKKIKNKDGLDIAEIMGIRQENEQPGPNELYQFDIISNNDDPQVVGNASVPNGLPSTNGIISAAAPVVVVDLLANYEEQVLVAHAKTYGIYVEEVTNQEDGHSDEEATVYTTAAADSTDTHPNANNEANNGANNGANNEGEEPVPKAVTTRTTVRLSTMDSRVQSQYFGDREIKMHHIAPDHVISSDPATLEEQYQQYQDHQNAQNAVDDATYYESPQRSGYNAHGEVAMRIVATTWTQIRLNLKRNLMQHYRVVVSPLTFVVVHVIASICVGSGFIGNAIEYLFLPPLPTAVGKYCPYAIGGLCLTEPLLAYAIVNAIFFTSLSVSACAVAQSVYTFGNELGIMHREAQTGVALMPYFVGKNMADLPFIFVGAVIFTAIFVPMLQPYQSIYLFFFIVLLIEFVTFGLGYLISASVKRQYTAPVIGVVIIFASCVCSGLQPSLRQVHSNFSIARLLWDFSFMRYANEALYVKELDIFLKGSEVLSGPTKTHLDNIGYYKSNFPLDILALIAFAIFFRVAAYYVLKRRIAKGE